MAKLGDSCRARATECALVGKAAGWRGDDALKAMYLTLAQQWLDIAEIGDAELAPVSLDTTLSNGTEKERAS